MLYIIKRIIYREEVNLDRGVITGILEERHYKTRF